MAWAKWFSDDLTEKQKELLRQVEYEQTHDDFPEGDVTEYVDKELLGMNIESIEPDNDNWLF